MAKSRRKYEKGERITTLDELYKAEFVWWNDKVYHKGWVRCWQFQMAYNALYHWNGAFHAVKIVED